jgi:hypothetical protein
MLPLPKKLELSAETATMAVKLTTKQKRNRRQKIKRRKLRRQKIGL